MPLVRIGPKLVYFAHIPKCAGTAIEDYLQDRFGKLAFVDRRYKKLQTPWTRSSPQHVTWKDLRRLFPPGFFNGSFAVVRHPVTRLRSVFHWQRDWEGTIPADTTFEAFVDRVAQMRRGASYDHDNHLRPMHQFIGLNTQVFRLEDGLAPVVDWLDKLAGSPDGAREIPRRNETVHRVEDRGHRYAPAPVSDATHARIATLYADDFARFGYDPGVNPLKEA